MTKDLRASQLQISKIISSGSTGTGAKLVIYDISADTAATPNQGIIDNTKFNTGSIGTDVFLYVSGGIGKTNVANSNAISVFGGDVYISGNLNIAGSGAASYWQSTGSNQIFTTGSIVVSASINALSGTQAITFATGSIGFRTNAIERLNISPTAISSTLPILGADGTFSAPGFAFQTQPGLGLYRYAADVIGHAIGGNLYTLFRATGIEFNQQMSVLAGAANGNVPIQGNVTTSTDAAVALGNRQLLAGAGVAQLGVQLTHTINQTGAASFTAFDILTTQTVTGSGKQYAIDVRTSSSTGITDVFNVSSRGDVIVKGDVIISGNLYVSASKRYAQYITVAGYLSTLASSSNPQVAGQTVISQSEVNTNSIVLRGVLSSFTGSVSASIKLYNVTSGAYVEIGGSGITTLSTTSTTATQVQSVNLMSAVNFGTGSNIYETQVFTSNTSTQVYHGSTTFVCT